MTAVFHAPEGLGELHEPGHVVCEPGRRRYEDSFPLVFAQTVHIARVAVTGAELCPAIGSKVRMHTPWADGPGERDVIGLDAHGFSPLSRAISGTISDGPSRCAVGITSVFDPASVGSDPDSDAHQQHRRISKPNSRRIR